MNPIDIEQRGKIEEAGITLQRLGKKKKKKRGRRNIARKNRKR